MVMKHRAALAASGLMVAALVLAGCGSSGAPASSSAAAASSSEASASVEASASASNASSAASASSASASVSASASSEGAAASESAQAAQPSESAQAAQTAQSAQSAQPTQPAELTQDDVANIVAQRGLGEIVNMDQGQADDGTWVWEVVTKGSDGAEHSYTVDANGNVAEESTSAPAGGNGGNGGNGGASQDGSPLSEDDVEDIIWQRGLGEIVDMEQGLGNDGIWYWEVTTRGSDGSETDWSIDPNGNVNKL